jgi:Type II secretion system (T2SS), protein G
VVAKARGAAVASVAESRSIARRVALIVGASVVAGAGATALYVFVNADQAKSVQTTAEAGRICKRGLAASAESTCASLMAETPRDPWGRDYLCEKLGPKHVRIMSLGRDGQPRGKAADADVICEPTAVGIEEHCMCSVLAD